MTAKHARTDATILAEIRRLRQLLERRKLVRTRAELVEARHEIEKLRAQLQAEPQTVPPTPSDPDTHA